MKKLQTKYKKLNQQIYLLQKTQLHQILHKKIVQKIHQNYTNNFKIILKYSYFGKNHKLSQNPNQIEINEDPSFIKDPQTQLHPFPFIKKIESKLDSVNRNLLKYLTTLSKFTDFECQQSILLDGNKFSDEFCKVLTSMTYLQSLNINFSGLLADRYTETNNKNLGKALSCLPSLTNLKFFSAVTCNIQSILSEYKTPTNLRKLHLILSTSQDLGQLDSISEFIQTCTNLTDLNISFKCIENFGNEIIFSIEKFKQSLQNIPNLQKLTLGLSEKSDLEDESFQDLLEAISSVHNLRELNLYITSFCIEEEGWKSFEILKTLKNLSHFYLYIGPYCKLKEQGCQNIQNLISNLSSLTSLELQIEYNNFIEFEGFQAIVKSVQQSKTIQKFVFKVKHTNFTKNFPNTSLEQQNNNNKNNTLKEMQIQIFESNKFKQNQFILFVNWLVHNQALQNLDLILPQVEFYDQKQRKEIYQDFFGILSEFDQLTYLKLFLKDPHLLQEQVVQIFETLQTQKTITTLDLQILTKLIFNTNSTIQILTLLSQMTNLTKDLAIQFREEKRFILNKCHFKELLHKYKISNNNI